MSDILHLLLAEIGEGQGQLRSDVISDSTGNANPTRLRKSLQPSRDIDGIAEKVVALNDDVADVDSNAEPHLLTGRSIRILFGYGLLHSDGTLQSIHATGEIGDEAVARRGEDPTAMRGDQGIDDGPVSVEGAKRAYLILPHETAVAFHIGGEDRGQLSFDGVRFHPRHLPNSEYRPTRCEIRGFLSRSEARWRPISGSNEVFTVSTRSPRTGSARGFSPTAARRPSTCRHRVPATGLF